MLNNPLAMGATIVLSATKVKLISADVQKNALSCTQSSNFLK
jgi:hypothetical protein